MKDKILLLGELKENTLCSEEILLTKYRVQKCSMVHENVEGMIMILHPDIIVACQLGDDDNTQEIYKWVRENHPEIPILILCEEAEWEANCAAYEWDTWQTLFTPFEAEELLLKTSVMIDVAKREIINKKKILLVDDNTVVLRNIRQILKDKYDVKLAKSGVQAIADVAIEDIDLILLDYEMPEMNGEETFKRLKAMDKAKNIPVIFLTGVSSRERIVRALKLGPAGYVLKPVKQNKLLSVVEEVLYDEGQSDETQFEEILEQYGEEQTE